MKTYYLNGPPNGQTECYTDLRIVKYKVLKRTYIAIISIAFTGWWVRKELKIYYMHRWGSKK